MSTDSFHDDSAVAAELRALGEAEFDPAEQPLQAEVEQVEDLFTLARLATQPSPPELGFWARRRVWRQIYRRVDRTEVGTTSGWRGAGLGLVIAMAAALVLALRVAPSATPAAASGTGLDALGAQVRASLERLPGTEGLDYVEGLTERYRQRLDEGLAIVNGPMSEIGSAR